MLFSSYVYSRLLTSSPASVVGKSTWIYPFHVFYQGGSPCLTAHCRFRLSIFLCTKYNVYHFHVSSCVPWIIVWGYPWLKGQTALPFLRHTNWNDDRHRKSDPILDPLRLGSTEVFGFFGLNALALPMSLSTRKSLRWKSLFGVVKPTDYDIVTPFGGLETCASWDLVQKSMFSDLLPCVCF